MAAVPTAEQLLAAQAAVRPIIMTSQIYAWCAISVLVWEFLVTMPSEMRLIWPAPWTPMKVLYFLNRYLTLPFMLFVGYLFTSEMSAESCSKIAAFEPYSLVVITFICDTILSVRTYALWGKNKVLGACLGAVVCAELAVQAWAAAGGAFVPLQGLQIPGCIWFSAAKKMNAFFAVSSFVVLLTFTLTTARIIMMWNKTGRSTLLVALLRDGALYFAIVFAVSLLNLISFVTQNPAGNPALHSPLAEVITSIMCTRIILSTRRHGLSSNEPSANTGSPTDGFSFKRTNNGQRSGFGLGTSPNPNGTISVQREVQVDFDTHDNQTLTEKSPVQSFTSPSPSHMELKPMSIGFQDKGREWDRV